MIFSWQYPLRVELCKKYKEGDVAEAKIVKFFPASMDIQVDGVLFTMRKVHVTGSRKTYDLMRLFEVGEIVKVYCMYSDDSGEMSWSMRALEAEPGALLVDKAKVFAEAEETAKIFYEKEQEEQRKMEREFFGTLENLFVTPPSASSVLSDDDEKEEEY